MRPGPRGLNLFVLWNALEALRRQSLRFKKCLPERPQGYCLFALEAFKSASGGHLTSDRLQVEAEVSLLSKFPRQVQQLQRLGLWSLFCHRG